ncbi:uncharacterized protein LOC575563 [Strongylocentrotus purpuratus]|uniref:G-protein coupled receptors family 3 profile domain-containing protein n=1 Tax=Strongylocentrotus purpuratus TaxID=7668 RepID=A0A7M7PBU9_STRPU|nr:uncharacterized protein LOC575563 [Strongylocentrotus purpuratus]
MTARCVLILIAVLTVVSATHAEQCRGRDVDEYQTSDADVIIGVMQSFYGSSDGMTCTLPMKNQEIYEAIKAALVALPSGMEAPDFDIGLERYESCKIPERAVADVTYYTAQIVNQVNTTAQGVYPCLDSPYRPGLIGPYTSGEAAAVSPILSSAEVPTISHSATSPSLSDKTEHGLFFRTVASDSVQAQAMVEFFDSFSWSYVHLVSSEGSYGMTGAEAFKDAAKGRVALASAINIPSTGANYDLIVSQLIANLDATVVAFWGSSSDLVNLLLAIQSRGGPALDLQIVGCDYDIPSDMMSAKGFFSIAAGELYNADVQNYLMKNNITTSSDKPMTYVPSAIDATHVYVDALRRAHSDKCGSSGPGICDAMKEMGSAEFVEMYVKTADFTGVSGRRIAFDGNGDPAVPAFEIRQLQAEGATLAVKKVGQWMGPGTLMVNENEIEFYLQNGVTNMPPTSSCSSDSCVVVYDHYDILNLAGIFPVHESDCATLSHHPGIDQAEAMLWAMDQVNRDSSLLPGMQLRPMLGESCSSPDQAASVTYDFVRHFTRQPNQAFGRYHNQDNMEYEYMAGVISRVDDEETVEIDQVLQPLGVPQVSDSARLPALSNKAEYPYFSRLVAPSCAMVSAIVAFLKEHDVTYVQVTQSRDGIYNTTAAKFVEEARKNGICVAQTITFEPITDFNGAVDRLLAKPSADIVVTFASNDDTQLLFSALERRSLPGEFLQMIYAFTADTNYLESWNREVHTDSITLRRKSTPVDDFVDHFISLTPQSTMEEGFFADTVHNTWFAEYWMNKFQCQLGAPNMPQLFTTPCSGSESLTRRDVYTAEGVINAVYVFAHALTNLHRNKCPGPRSDGLCDAMLATSPLEWARYLHEVRFLSRSGSMAEVSFDENGDAPSAFNILALDHYLVNKVLATYEDDTGLVTVDDRFAVGSGKESSCRGACYECSDSTELGGTYLRIPGDFDVTAVLWLSEEGEGANLTCGATRHQETMAIEIIKHALEEINNSSLILPDLKLGLTIVDSCGQFLVTARQLTSLIGRTASNLPPTGPMLGVLGPVREYLQGHVASDVTSPFYIPTIGFTPASPSVFSDEGPYPASSLLSTAPAYDNEAVAAVDILKYKGWHHVIFVYSHSYYGHAGNESFNNAARAGGICVRDSIGIDLDSPQSTHDDIVQMIRDYGITVVVAFVESTDARNLLTAEMESSQGPGDKITWIGSDKWFTDPDVDVTAGLESVARGAIVVTNYMVDYNPLKEHLSNLDLVKETNENHWLRNYVTDEFTNGCTSAECIQAVDLGKQGVIPPYTATLTNAVHAIAQAAHNKIQLLCGNGEFVGHVYKRSNYHQRPNVSVPLCPEFFEASWHDLLYAVKDVYVFEGAGRRPFWFENRQGPAEYSIINFQGEGSTGSFVPIGEWISGELTMEDSMTYLYNEAANQPIDAPSECPSVLSECPTAGPETQPSGWTWSTNMESWSIIVLIVTAIVGFLCVATIFVIIGRRDSAILKSSNPFLMTMLAVGIILMYLNNIWYMVSPVESACGVQRWMTSFSYSVVYAVLVTKTLCASFMARSDVATKSILNSFPMHIVLFCVLLGAEVILVTEWLILDAPSVDAAYEVTQAGCMAFIGQACNHDNVSIIVSMIYVYILVLTTLVMSFFSSHRLRGTAKKENKFHLLTSLLSICFLVSWACCYTLLPQKNYQTPAILIGITVDATSIFLCNIVPKMLAFFNGDEDDMSEVSDVTETYKEKSGFENKGMNETDDQTPL